MSIAHAQEVSIDYMNDSNWRKMIRIGRSPQCMLRPVELTLLPADSLCRKRSRAKKGVSETKPAFETVDRVSGCGISPGMDRPRTYCHGANVAII